MDEINNTGSVKIGDRDPSNTNEVHNYVTTSVATIKVWDDDGWDGRPA